MSQMLKNAVIDAQALKEQALKNAEATVIEKFSPQIKEAVDRLLEQEDDPFAEEPTLDDVGSSADEGLDGSINIEVPLAATDGETLCPCQDDQEEIEIDFDELERQMAADPPSSDEMRDREEFVDNDEELEKLMEELQLEGCSDLDEGCDEEKEELEETPNSRLRAKEDPRDKRRDQKYLEETEEEDSDEDDELLEELSSVIEEMVVDAVSSERGSSNGWLGTNEGDLELQSDQKTASDTADDGAKKEEKEEKRDDSAELMGLRGKVTSLNEKLSRKEKKLSEYKELLGRYKNKLQEVNLDRAKLFYSKLVLEDVSLNERQTKSIVESISKSTNVESTKVIYETLKDAVGSRREDRRGPKSLHEASRGRPVQRMTPRKEQETNKHDPEKLRLQKLAGITKGD